MKKLLVLFSILLSTAAGAQLRFSCRFTMVDQASGRTVSTGTGYVQDDCYRLETDGLKIYCNGKDRWIYAPESDELVIEKNDVSFLKEIAVNRKSDGTAVVGYGNYTITLTDIRETETPWPGVFFIIDPDSFGDDTVITDLR